MITGKQISLQDLPSKGCMYGEGDFEILVKPMSVREEMSLNLGRFGVSKAGYYDSLLESIEIVGNFDKNKLLFGDVEYLDLVRRLFTYELEEAISIGGEVCDSCGKELDISFMFANDEKCKNFIEFEDYKEDAFGKEYTFYDGTKVKTSPITIDKIIKMFRKYVSNGKEMDLIELALAYKAALVVEAKNKDDELKQFDSYDGMQKYFIKYFGDLYKNKDNQILIKMDEDSSIKVKPFKIECNHCSEITEVGVSPSMQFRQE